MAQMGRKWGQPALKQLEFDQPRKSNNGEEVIKND